VFLYPIYKFLKFVITLAPLEVLNPPGDFLWVEIGALAIGTYYEEKEWALEGVYILLILLFILSIIC
jgi:hypothetical protein